MVYYVVGIMIGVGVLGMLGLLVYYYSTKKKYKKNKVLYKKDQIVIKNKSSFKDVFDKIYQSFYMISLRIPVVSYYTRKTRLKLEMVNDYTEYEIRRRTGSIILKSVLFVIIALFIFLNVVDDLIMSLMVIIMVFIVNDVMIDSQVNKVADKIVRQIPEVFTQIRHSFHEHGMIEEAFNEAIDELEDKEIMPQIRRIREAITSDNPEVELERYYDVAPNRFLKLFAGISYLTMELGDRKVDGVSVYLKNLNNILNDAYLDLLKSDSIRYKFRSLTAIAVAPIFFIEILKDWAVSNFSTLTNFYSSSFAFIIKAAVLISIFVSYFGLKVIKDDSGQIKFDKISTKRWQEKVYKIPIVKQIVSAFMPAENTRKYIRKSQNIKGINAYLTMEWFYVNKFAYAVISFVVVLILCLNMHHIDVQSVYTALSDEFTSLGQLSEEDQKAAEDYAKKDAETVQELKDKGKITVDDVKVTLQQKGETATDEDAQRILDKIDNVKSAYLKFWEVIIAFGVAWIAFFVPDLILIIKNKIRAMEKEDEIMQFQSIILMLMYIERVDVQTLLEWLERYSYAFKEPIATALNNYEAGALEALEELRDAVPHKDFKRICEGLMSAVERIPIKDAFDELETERSFYYERRKEANTRIVDQKYTYGKALGFAPMIILLTGYFIGPLMVVSVLQLVNYMDTMGA
ncbi:MAG: hypothetical protein IKV94_04980 [Clostridia bacterium]|nr:hypothetical protein [Clostridia bacterium]